MPGGVRAIKRGLSIPNNAWHKPATCFELETNTSKCTGQRGKMVWQGGTVYELGNSKNNILVTDMDTYQKSSSSHTQHHIEILLGQLSPDGRTKTFQLLKAESTQQLEKRRFSQNNNDNNSKNKSASS